MHSPQWQPAMADLTQLPPPLLPVIEPCAVRAGLRTRCSRRRWTGSLPTTNASSQWTSALNTPQACCKAEESTTCRGLPQRLVKCGPSAPRWLDARNKMMACPFYDALAAGGNARKASGTPVPSCSVAWYRICHRDSCHH